MIGLFVCEIADYALTPIDLSSDTIDTTNKKYAILDCSHGSECHHVNGYIKDSDGKVYSVDQTDGTTVEVIPANGKSTVANSCKEKVGTLYKSNDKIYLCLTEDRSVEFASTGVSKNYLMDYVPETIFTSTTEKEDTKIMITAAPSIFYFHVAPSGVKAYSVTTDTNEISSPLPLTSAVTPASGAKIFLYECDEEGYCQVRSGALFDGTNYMTVSEDGTTAATTASALVVPPLNDATTDNGILYVIDNAANNIYTGVSEAQNSIVVKASYHIVSLVKMTDGVHALEVNSLNSEAVEDILGEDGSVLNPSNIKLYNCVENDCKETFGYVLIGTIYYVSKVTGVSEVFDASSKTSCEDAGAVGGLATITSGSDRKRAAESVVNFCLTDSIKAAINTDATVDDVNYVMTNGGSTIFTTATGTDVPFIVIKSTANAFVLNNVLEGKEILTLNNFKVKKKKDKKRKRNIYRDINKFYNDLKEIVLIENIHNKFKNE